MKTVIAGAALVLAMAGAAAAQDQAGEHHHEGGGRQGGQPSQPHAQGPQGQARPQGQPGGGFQGRGGGFQRPQSAPAQAAPAPATPAQLAPAAPFQPGRSGGQTFPGGQGGYRGSGRPSFPGGQGGYRGGASPGAQAAPAPAQPAPSAQGQPGRSGGSGRGFDGQRFGGGRQGAPGGYQGRSGYEGRQGSGANRFENRGGFGGRGFSYRGNSYARFHAAPFRFPRGYAYRPYRLHERLPYLFLAPSFFLNDYSDFYLSPPPSAQYRWVRYGPDALLVDTYSGEVVDAAYGVFDDGSDYGDDGYPPPAYGQPGPY